MKTTGITISLSPSCAAIIRRFRKVGRYDTNAGVVRAALERMEETTWEPNLYPPGSLRHLYTPSRKVEELALNKVSSLRVDHDD